MFIIRLHNLTQWNIHTNIASENEKIELSNNPYWGNLSNKLEFK